MAMLLYQEKLYFDKKNPWDLLLWITYYSKTFNFLKFGKTPNKKVLITIRSLYLAKWWIPFTCYTF